MPATPVSSQTLAMALALAVRFTSRHFAWNSGSRAYSRRPWRAHEAFQTRPRYFLSAQTDAHVAVKFPAKKQAWCASSYLSVI